MGIFFLKDNFFTFSQKKCIYKIYIYKPNTTEIPTNYIDEYTFKTKYILY